MAGRPRPVTATVTKPRWMQLPDPESVARYRHNQSLNSHGSDDSLASLLEKVGGYNSEEDNQVEKSVSEVDNSGNLDKTYTTDKESLKENRKVCYKTDSLNKNNNNNNKSDSLPVKTKSVESSLSAWEQWIVHKAKHDQMRLKEEKRKKREEKAQKDREEQEKQIKLQKAEANRKQWTEAKNKDYLEKKKEEKIKNRNMKLQKEEIDNQIKKKAEDKYSLWTEMKKKEEKEQRKKVKEEKKRIAEHEAQRREMAEAKFQQWLKQAEGRPRSAPNSFGYLSGKMTGYHDRSAYPTPTYVNPAPWQPPAAPTQQRVKTAAKRATPKPYRWNPDKYF